MEENDEKLRDVFNSISDVFIRSDMNGKCVMVTPSIYQMTGYQPEELLGRNMTDFYANPNQRNEIVDKLLKSRSVDNFEFEVIRKDGRKITVSTNTKIFYDKHGSPLGVEGIIRDITEQKKAESEHDKLFNFSFDLLCIAGFDGYFKELNPAWEKVTGYTIIELKEKPFLNFIHEDDRIKTQEEIKSLSKGGHSFYFENRYIRRSGEIIYLSWTATPLPKENLMYCIARDVTDQKTAEQNVLEYQQRLRNLTHELTISEEKIRKQIAVDLHDYVGQMLTSSRMQLARIIELEKDPELALRMKNITQALLSAIQATRTAIFDLSPPQLNEIGLYAAVNDWMIDQIERKHGVQTSISGEEEVYKLEENTRFLIFRSIKELMMNVVKHAKARHLSISLIKINEILKVTVEDDGVGFNYSPNLLKLKSNSFGLFSIQERIAGLGGSMTINSAINKGTQVKLQIPLKRKDNEK